MIVATREKSPFKCWWCWCSKWTMDIGHGPRWRLIVGVGQELVGREPLPRESRARRELQTRLDSTRQSGAWGSGTGVRTLQEIRCYGIWASGEVQATKGTAEKGAFLIGKGALLNRARYVPCSRTALDWADTADIPSTTAGLQAPR